MPAITINGKQHEIAATDPAQSLARFCRERAGDQASCCAGHALAAFPCASAASCGRPGWNAEGTVGKRGNTAGPAIASCHSGSTD